VRPAVSVGRASALDEFYQSFSLLDGIHPNAGFDHLFGFPEPSFADNEFLTNEILPVTNDLSLDFDHLAGNNVDYTDFDINNYVHDAENTYLTSQEIQPENESVEKTTSLQPPIGASFNGCDDGRIAVSV